MNLNNKDYYNKSYPLLTEFELYDDSEDDNYNCISYSVGVTDRGFWPIEGCDDCWYGNSEVSVESFDLFYKKYGFEKCNFIDVLHDKNYTKVALFLKNGKPTHASIQIDNDWWESKIGQLGIIKHYLFELECEIYGEVCIIYKKRIHLSESLKRILNFNNFIRQKTHSN